MIAWTLTLPALSAALALACSSEPLDAPSTPAGAGGASDTGAAGGSGAKDDAPPCDENGCENATCATFANMLAACAVIDGTRVPGCSNDDPVLPCAAACVANADCAEIGAVYCNASFNDFAACIEACRATLPVPEFACDDGMTIPSSFRCDGAEDCAGGEDERCPAGVFTCRDGLNVPAGWQCDGVEDCPEGDDELDCPNGPMVACGDGTRISARRDCDGATDCANGEDERGCATLICR